MEETAKPNDKKRRTAFWIILLLLTVISYISVATFSNNTFISIAKVIGISLIAASLLSVPLTPLWKRLTGFKTPALNILCSSVFLTGFFSALFLIINFWYSEPEGRHMEKAVVERKYSETRHRSKRISRNRYTRGEEYKVYYIDVCFDSRCSKTLSVTMRQYGKIHRGDTLLLPVEKGFFGFPVIKRKGSLTEVPRSRYVY